MVAGLIFTVVASTGVAIASVYCLSAIIFSPNMVARIVSRRDLFRSQLADEPGLRSGGCCTTAMRLAAWASVSFAAVVE